MLRVKGSLDSIEQQALKKQKIENQITQHFPKDLIIQVIFQAIKKDNHDLIDAQYISLHRFNILSYINCHLVSKSWNACAKAAAVAFASFGGCKMFNFFRSIFACTHPLSGKRIYNHQSFKKFIAEYGREIQAYTVDGEFEDGQTMLDLIKFMPHLKSIYFDEVKESLVKKVIGMCPCIKDLRIDMFDSEGYSPDFFELIDQLKLQKLDYTLLQYKNLTMFNDKLTTIHDLSLYVCADEMKSTHLLLEQELPLMHSLKITFSQNLNTSIALNKCANLTRLHLGNVSLTHIDWMAISFPKLQELFLDNCIGDAVLFRNQACFEKLVQFVICKPPLGDAQVSEIGIRKITKEYFPQLHVLALKSCALTDEILLKCNACFQRLDRLDISGNSITDMGITAIVSAQPIDKPIEINIEDTLVSSHWLNILRNRYPSIHFEK